MRLVTESRGRPTLGVFRMAFSLAFAAFLGGALGLVWQSTSFFDDADSAEEEVLTADPDAADADSDAESSDDAPAEQERRRPPPPTSAR